MEQTQQIDWQDPLTLARSISKSQYQDDWAFLYSGLNSLDKNCKSYLALYPRKKIISDNFESLKEATKNKDKWFGYLSYDLKNNLETLPQDQDGIINLPNIYFIKFGLVVEFNHDKQSILCQYDDESLMHIISKCTKKKLGDLSKPNILNIDSNFSKAEYFEKLSYIKSKIAQGDLYQANLTRKFYGKIKSDNKFDIFAKLNQSSPANYSSFLKLGGSYIISSSPELFLEIDAKNKVLSSPIKGTAPRFGNAKKDELSREFLLNSKKDKAENLMVVDLTRNDLSKSCQAGSVKASKLFQVNSYKTLHHMVSNIIGIKDDKLDNIDVIKGCFPPPSMTGMPKIKAMEICSAMEVLKRGVYSGAIGFLSKKNCTLSVVIRTLLVQGNNFEFQVGGAITSDSKPISEWEECINKSKGIANCLEIEIDDLKRI